jgi:FAD/FMN-containing dehydrogenase
MDVDYTIDQPVIGSLQDALDLGLGRGRLAEDGCLRARSVDEVEALFSAAHRFGAAVTVGFEEAPGLSLDLSGLTQVRDMDTVSHIVTAESGITIARLEAVLAAEGLIIERGLFGDGGRCLGDALAAGEGASLVVSVGAVLPNGTVFHTPIAPRRATGPNPDALLVGSNMRTAVIVWAALRVSAMVHPTHQPAWQADAGALLEATRRLFRDGLRPAGATLRKGAKGRAVLSLSLIRAADEATVSQAMAAIGATPCKYDDAAPPRAVARRLSWSQLDALVTGTGRQGLWVGPIDLHGGWTRVPRGRKRKDARLDQVVQCADPLSTIRGSQ